MRYILALFIVILFSSCVNDNNNDIYKEKPVDSKEIDSSLEKANRYMLLQESERIEEYIERHKLTVNRTGTGLRYQIIQEGDGELIKKGDLVTLEYEVRLLTGDRIYSSKDDGNKSFVVGRGGVESGLEEAILKLRMNSAAVLILPAHLAHGLIGDGNKIPAKAALVYRIKVIDIK